MSKNINRNFGTRRLRKTRLESQRRREVLQPELVEGFPGFVGISNLDFRGFQNFTFLIQKKKKMIRSIIEICPTPLRKC